ncbi:hypothetical protein [Spirosoma sp. 209]|uniref:hypothetical protein n=1 Tax=Spirosoma sp. 209 TaxID=1955701 RepID=UPI001115AD66|nr:hypothetical protein [Spirosoma sp. 209]
MKTSLHSATRLLVSVIALTTLLQLAGCQEPDVKPRVNQPAQTNAPRSMPKPAAVEMDSVGNNLPYMEPQQ